MFGWFPSFSTTAKYRQHGKCAKISHFIFKNRLKCLAITALKMVTTRFRVAFEELNRRFSWLKMYIQNWPCSIRRLCNDVNWILTCQVFCLVLKFHIKHLQEAFHQSLKSTFLSCQWTCLTYAIWFFIHQLFMWFDEFVRFLMLSIFNFVSFFEYDFLFGWIIHTNQHFFFFGFWKRTK